MKEKQAQLFEMLTDLKDFDQQIKQAKSNSEKTKIVNKMLLVMFCEPNYIDKMLEILNTESEE